MKNNSLIVLILLIFYFQQAILGQTWLLKESILGDNRGDGFGISISSNTDGSVFAVGASQTFGKGKNWGIAGSVKIYEVLGDTLIQKGKDIEGYGLTGTAVSMSDDGTVLAVSSIGTDENGPATGSVRIYKFNENKWTQIGKTIVGIGASWFGSSLSLSADGATVVIGGPTNDFDGIRCGYAVVYRYIKNEWIQIGQDLSGLNYGDEFGTSVDISSDGQIIAVGAPNFDYTHKGSGIVKVFRYENYGWQQLGQDLSIPAPNTSFGKNVKISSDGLYIAIESRYRNGNMLSVYTLSENSWEQLGKPFENLRNIEHVCNYFIKSRNDTVFLGIIEKEKVIIHYFGKDIWKIYDSFYHGIGLKRKWSSELLVADFKLETIIIGTPYEDNQKGRVRIYRQKNQ